MQVLDKTQQKKLNSLIEQPSMTSTVVHILAHNGEGMKMKHGSFSNLREWSVWATAC